MTPYTKEYIDRLEKEVRTLRLERRVFMSICIIAAVAVAILTYGFRHTAHQITIQNNEIQRQRYDAIYRNCFDQNLRHDHALSALLGLLKKSGVSKARREQAYSQTALLINALAPKQNCRALASNSTNSTG